MEEKNGKTGYSNLLNILFNFPFVRSCEEREERERCVLLGEDRKKLKDKSHRRGASAPRERLSRQDAYRTWREE